jgi:hypothetical protein
VEFIKKQVDGGVIAEFGTCKLHKLNFDPWRVN